MVWPERRGHPHDLGRKLIYESLVICPLGICGWIPCMHDVSNTYDEVEAVPCTSQRFFPFPMNSLYDAPLIIWGKKEQNPVVRHVTRVQKQRNEHICGPAHQASSTGIWRSREDMISNITNWIPVLMPDCYLEPHCMIGEGWYTCRQLSWRRPLFLCPCCKLLLVFFSN